MENNKYVIEDDADIRNAGFTGQSKYDIERAAIMEELDKYSHKSMVSTWILTFFLGLAGVHHFTNGRILRGFIYFFTCGLFGIGWIVDMIKIIAGKFTDASGRYINDSKVIKLNMQLAELDEKYSR